MSWSCDVVDEAETARLADSLAEALPERMTVALEGTLGAGKTRFVRGLAVAVGLDPRQVVSPTFTLVHEYDGPRPIVHIDAYRLQGSDEFFALGSEEFFERPGWTVIEWASRVAEALPADRLEVSIEVTGPTARRFRWSATGEGSRGVIERLTAAWSSRG